MIARHINLLLISLSICVLIMASLLGPTALSFERYMGGLLGYGAEGDVSIIWQIRLPRAICVFAVGLALGASGAALQGLLRNPLAEPGVLGVSASASLFAALAVYYGAIALSPIILPIAAITGALLATFIILIAAFRLNSIVSLILVGVGLSSLSGALMSLLMNLAPNPFTLTDLMNWTLGTVANRSFDDLALSGPFIALGLGCLWSARKGLSVLGLGEETAQSLGLNIRYLRLWIVIGAGLATGGSVALAGAIGFVGIIAPHIVRPFVGFDPAKTLLPSALLAGIILVISDILVRLIPTPNELKLGVLAALIGAPIFIWIAATRRGVQDG